MTEPCMDGFRPEPENPKHWDFEDLRPRMGAMFHDDVDLRPWTSPRHNQRGTNSCVAQSTVKALEIKRIQEHGHEAHIDLSRLAVYYLARELMFPQETHKDEGTFIGHAFDVLRRFGVPPEADWPWDTDMVCTPPSWMAMFRAYRHKISAFYKIKSTGTDRIQAVIDALRAGNPVVFGTETGSNWSKYKKGETLYLPDRKRGRHATVLIGYIDGKFLGENSWGTGWGDDGFYLMDDSVIASSKSKDFWVPQTGYEPVLP
jgi:C1A family cysteine protease